MDQEKIGRFVADLRREKGMTQAQLAAHLGITDKSVSKWERGVCLPDASNYQPLCEVLGISISEFFAGERIDSPADPSIAEAAALSLAEDGETNRRRYRRIIAALAAAGLLLLAVILFAMWQTVRDPFSFKDHIRQSQMVASQQPLIRMMAGSRSPFLYDFSFKHDLPWLSFTLREYRKGELINETLVGAVEVGWNREDSTKKAVTGSIALLPDWHAGQLTVSVCDAKGGIYSWDAAMEPLPESESIDYYPQLGGSVIEKDREIFLVGYAYNVGENNLMKQRDSGISGKDLLLQADYGFSIVCRFGSKPEQ